MNKRTRIAVVAAALAFGAIAISAVGAAGDDRAGTGGIATGQHVGDGVQPQLAGAPRIDWRFVDDVIRGLKGRVPQVQRQGELVDMACKVKDMVVLENAPPDIRRQFPPPIATPRSWLDLITRPQPPRTLEQWREQEIRVRLQRLAGWSKTPAGQRATLQSLTKDLAQAKDYGDGAMIGVDLFCLGAGLYYDARS